MRGMADAERWQGSGAVVVSQGRKRHDSFTPEEDRLLRKAVEELGADDRWRIVAERIPGRNSRQCKERWVNCLNPLRNTRPWTPGEDELLLAKQAEIGSKWAAISRLLENRTAVMCQSRFGKLRRAARRQLNPPLPVPRGVIMQRPMAWTGEDGAGRLQCFASGSYGVRAWIVM
jgi:myb proto-oncogene protein